jgi:thioredoxin-related protein
MKGKNMKKEEKSSETIVSRISDKKAQGKGLFQGASSKLIFFFGLATGLAFFSLFSLALLSLIIFAPQVKKEVSITESKQAEEEKILRQTQEIKEKETSLNEPEVNKFTEKEGKEICKEDGKPMIRLYSTTRCSHCTWIKDTFDKVVKEYMDKGKIVAYHWEVDINDNTLTEEKEKEIPEKEMAVYQEFNPRGSIPTFVFGCKYWRIGTGYERENDLAKEEADFREIIEKLLKAKVGG